jgi:hypothetical protein
MKGARVAISIILIVKAQVTTPIVKVEEVAIATLAMKVEVAKKNNLKRRYQSSK